MDRLKIFIRYIWLILIMCFPFQCTKASIGEGEYLFSSIIIKGTTNVNKFLIEYHNDTFTPFSVNNTKEDSLILSIPAEKFTAESKLMLSDFLALINASEYPYINIIIRDKLNRDFFNISKGAQKEILVGVNGVTNSYFCNTDLQETFQNKWYFSGELNIKLSDFNIEPPEKFFGLVKVKDTVSISFKILFVIEN